MRKLSLLFLSAVLLAAMSMVGGAAEVTADDSHNLRLDIAALVMDAPVPIDCGKEATGDCPSLEHEITKEGSGVTYQSHGCQSPATHGGPGGCGAPTMRDLIDKTPTELRALADEDPQLRFNHELQRVEVLDCAMDHVVLSAPFSFFGLTATSQ